jgi:type VII secretion protein EssB
MLHPENLVVDRNLRVKVAYRGLAGVMPPKDMDDEHFLRQYKALVLSTFDKKAPFSSLFDGSITLKRTNAFEREVQQHSTVTELANYLTTVYDQQIAKESKALVRVGRRSHRAYKIVAIWASVLALAGMGGVAYYTFYYGPHQERLLSADAAFVTKNYQSVIQILAPESFDTLPAAQRYELAYSYLYGTTLTEQQQATILNNMSINSAPDFLRYWIWLGRGDLEGALDTAKGLNDVDLILYAITLLQEQVRADSRLSGTDREARNKELQSQYDQYLKQRTDAITGPVSPSPSPAPSLPLSPSSLPSPSVSGSQG